MFKALNNAGQAGLSKFIFGQAATILARDVYITSAAALIIIVLTALFWKELKLISFDVGIRQNTTNSRHFHPYFISFIIDHDHHYRHSIGRGYLD